MRGKNMKGGSLEVPFRAWQHLEALATVTVVGDTATSISLHIHTHETRDGKKNLFDVGLWHDQWARTNEGWLIKDRHHQSLYTNTFPVVESPSFLQE